LRASTLPGEKDVANDKGFTPGSRTGVALSFLSFRVAWATRKERKEKGWKAGSADAPGLQGRVYTRLRRAKAHEWA